MISEWRDRMFRRSVAYRQCFLGPDGELTPAAKIVLADLSRFASLASGPTVVSPVSRQTDVPATMQRVGRGESVQRIWRYLKLPINKLFEIEESQE